MLDVFSEEVELLIKSGISNLYWYKAHLKKTWLNSGVPSPVCEDLFSRTNSEGKSLTKRRLMDLLYEELRNFHYDRRLEISRNFVRILIERENFEPEDNKHKIEISKNSSIKLKEIIARQKREQEKKEYKEQEEKKEDYYSQQSRLKERFIESYKFPPQKRGYELEKIFSNLMRISGIPVEDSFKIVGEQIDGAIKYDAYYYLVELKWIAEQVNQSHISSLYMKVEGKMQSFGLFIAMNGYSEDALSSLTTGKNIKVLLLDGIHLMNVISGIYTFQQLLEHARKQAAFKGKIYCSHDIN
ncbi:restriction endonuclease [Nostoc sphaeroides CHAB 2801]|uniref:restriction endonuclease n=1 Tax=Nostoc sphaeroides TaxID=446679 RepID=UPI000E4C1571|nr:restriction endonuclease [Nostoc sphaeroides]MCC5627310.1 restriction endonuclease [Nostoc sphaeroides CHAB 2801]